MALQTERGPNPWLQGLQSVQSLQDIQSLIEAEVPEGQHLEYRRDLPGGAESWNSDRKLSTEAKKKILQEVVAFANAYGGTLLLGIEGIQDRAACSGWSALSVGLCGFGGSLAGDFSGQGGTSTTSVSDIFRFYHR